MVGARSAPKTQYHYLSTYNYIIITNDTTTRCSANAAIEQDAAFSSMVVAELDIFFFFTQPIREEEDLTEFSRILNLTYNIK